ncbi:MAG: alpha/beta hydrolase [Pyrinomonadaceae bacterium]
MAHRRTPGKRVAVAMMPIALLILLAVGSVTVWLGRSITRPLQGAYLVTPQTFSQLSGPVLKATDETWPNRDGTESRGWLLRGTPGAPAVILYHRFGADRSWLLNLSVKINEATNFTVLWPDLRGHGLDPPVKWSSFGTYEADDVSAAIDFVRSLKAPGGAAQVGDKIGLYGVELGAYAVLAAAERHPEVRALVLDSVPSGPDDLLDSAAGSSLGTNNVLLRRLARVGVRIYFMGKYRNTPSCQLAASFPKKHVLLISGEDAGYLRDSTTQLQGCFGAAALEAKTDLPLTGLNLPSATGQVGEGYDRVVIDFFDKALRGGP